MAQNLETLIHSFREMQPKFSRLYTRVLNEAGITQPQYALLLELMHAPSKPMSMTAISQKLYITKPAVTNLVDRLEKRQYLKRINHPQDRRVSLLEIQAKGKKVTECVQERFLEIILHTVKPLSAQERSIIEKFYSGLSISLDQMLCAKKECSA